MDIARSIRMAVDTGNVVLGTDKSLKLLMTGSPKLVILASNAPATLQSDVKRYSALANVTLLTFNGSSIELGKACGKPFPVALCTVLEAGNSDILTTASPDSVSATTE